MSSLRESARDILRANDRGGYTVPSPGLYPHQWAWDSAFAAIGWATFDPPRGLRELETLLGSQWPDGRIPHIRFHRAVTDYFPGPDFWETAGRPGTNPHHLTSSITQPPVWAMAARRVLMAGADPDGVKGLLPAIERSHIFFRRQRDPLNYGVVSVAHPWESGLDNSPAWDEPLQAVDPSDAPLFQRSDVKRVGDASIRPRDDEYKRYAALVKAIRRRDFGHGPFAVYDPFMTAIAIGAEDDLAWLAEALGVESRAADRARVLRQGLLRHLWSEPEGRFCYYDIGARKRLTPDILAAYVPLMIGISGDLAGEMKQALRERYQTTWPLPTVSSQMSIFDSRRYWRGPVWINLNWLLLEALDGEWNLKKRTLALIEQNGFFEYYHPMTGEGLGAKGFSWTAALTLDLLGRRV